jgi:hypothetical protein
MENRHSDPSIKSREQVMREHQIDLWESLTKARYENHQVNALFRERERQGLSDTHMLLILTDLLLKQNILLMTDLLHKKSISVEKFIFTVKS